MSYSSLIGEKAKVATFFTKNADVGLDGLQFLTQIGNIDPDNRLIHIFLILPNSLKRCSVVNFLAGLSMKWAINLVSLLESRIAFPATNSCSSWSNRTEPRVKILAVKLSLTRRSNERRRAKSSLREIGLVK